MKFDCLLTNPPYQDSSHSEKKILYGENGFFLMKK